jgi:hypothetical protein
MPDTDLQIGGEPGRRKSSRKVVTVMFAEMVGYSTQLQSDQARNSAQAAKSICLFKSLISDYSGKVATSREMGSSRFLGVRTTP